MKRYYFDVDDGSSKTEDSIGNEFEDRAQAREAAIGLLPAIAGDVLPDGETRRFDVKVREANPGPPIFEASLVFFSKWLDQDPAKD